MGHGPKTAPEIAPEIARGFLLHDKVAVITGAGSGLGREASRIFALAGARVIAVDIDNEGLMATAAQSPPEAVLARTADVSRRTDIEALADWSVQAAGRLDIWVNGAGISYLDPLLKSREEQADRTVAVNMMGSYWGTVAAGRVMSQAGGGTIINISSGGGSKPLPGIGIYGMTKAAVNSLTWTSAAEFGPMGIRVNAIAPGWIETPMSRELFRDDSGRITDERRDAVRREMAAKSPLGILGTPTDIAFALLFLASDASRFVTGQVLAVNGGESM